MVRIIEPLYLAILWSSLTKYNISSGFIQYRTSPKWGHISHNNENQINDHV